MPISFTCPHCGNSTEVDDQYAGQSGPCSGCGQTITIPGPTGTAPFKQIGPSPAPRSGGGGTSVVLIIVIVLMCSCLAVGGLVALLLPAVQAAREAARRMQCSNNLKQIVLALHNYHDVNNCFPAAYVSDNDGKPAHSWRVALLPYLERSDLFDQYSFDEPWDSPNNQMVADRMPDVFACPSSPTQPGKTNYVVIIGDPNQFPQTLFTGDKWTKLSEITDGTSNTIAVVETTEPVPWTQPDTDLKFSTMSFSLNSGPNSIGSLHPGGANVSFADGSVHFLSDAISDEQLRLMIQPTDGQVVQIY